jgi:STE24 endopeptidase
MRLYSLLVLVLICLPSGAQDLPRQNIENQPTSLSQPASASTTAYTLPPDKLEKAKALYTLEGRLRIIDPIYSVLILLGLLFFGIAARYRNWAESVSRWRFVQAFIFVPLLSITISVLGLPLRIYAHHVSLQYGLSVQGWSSWFVDFLKGEGVSSVVMVVLLWILTTVIRKSPRHWWFYSWLAMLPILVFLVFVAPVIIDPIFNKFEPLEQKQPRLVEAIETVVQRGGLSIPRSRMYEMKASEKVTTLNAYVTGFGSSKRVVVWDTTIEKMTTPETLFVFGHEMGHYVLNHIIYGLILGAIGLLIGLYLIYRLSGWVLKRFQQRWHIRELGDWAALPMIFLLFSILGFFAEPITNVVSRHFEHEADVYGLEVTHGINPNSQEAAAHAFQVLGELSLDYPYPSKFVVLWYYDHPAISDRVRFAHEYDPWSKGQAPKYVK